MVVLGTDRPVRRWGDARLVPAAVGVWGVAWFLLDAGVRTSFVVGLGLACGAVGLGILRGFLPVERARGLAGLTVLTLTCCAAAAFAVAGRHFTVASSPVTHAAAAESHARVDVGLVITGDPRSRAGPTLPGRPEYIVPARTEWIETETGRVPTRVAVVVLASGPEWRDLVPSQRVTATARIVPAESTDFTAALALARDPPWDVSTPRWYQYAAGVVRERLRASSAALPQPERALVPALVTGDVSELPEETVEDFRVTGLTHVMVPSGAKLAIMTGCVLGIARAVRAPVWATVVGGAVMIAVFVVVCRPEPSVLRAAVTGGIALLALALGRPNLGLAALNAAVVGLLLFTPDLARSFGFALSVLATAGLLVLSPRWRDRWTPTLGPAVAEATAVALAAQVAVYPLLVILSGEVSMVAVPVNVLAAVMVPVATIAGFVVAGLAVLWMSAAALAVWVPGAAVAWINVTAEYGARVPHAAVPWPDTPIGILLLTFLLVCAVVARGRIGRVVAIAATLALLTTVAIQAFAPGWPPRGWALVVCDVGQGDGLVLAAGGSRAVVIDAGPDPMRMHRCLRDLAINEVSLLVLTHDHQDHVAGTSGVLRHRSVDTILTTASVATGTQAGVLAPVEAPLHLPVPGQVFQAADWELRVLWPEPDSVRDANDDSVVLRADYGAGRHPGFSVLLTGDIEESAQRALIDNPNLDVDVLKTPHHGGGTTDPAFVHAVAPRMSVTSLGADNPHGHPHPDTWDALVEAGSRNLRTDLDGDIAVRPGPEGPTAVTRGPEPHRYRGRYPRPRRPAPHA